MPRFLSLEWDQHEARYVLASIGRGKLSIERAGSIPLPAAEGDRPAHEQIGRAMGQGLRATGALSGVALIGVSRSSIELAQLSLPPTPDHDLPDMVRYQASRELGSFTEGAPLDFVALPSTSDDSRTVLAAALPREHLQQIEAVCAAAHVRPQRLLVRPHAAGSLLFKQMRPREQVSLLVNCFNEEADMAVLVDGRVLLCRTVRMPKPAEGESPSAPILAEIRRTIFAVQNQPGGGQVRAVYLCGGADEHRELVRSIQEELSLAAEVFQPFSGLQLSRELERSLPENPGRYASLLGMLSDEAEGTHSLDFLNPRKPPQPVSRRKLAIAAAAAAALVLAGAAYYAWGKFAEVEAQIAQLNRRGKQLDQTVRRATEKEVAAAAIEEWLMADVVWLDELRDLSLRFPKPRDAVLLRMTLAGKPTGGGAIELEGLVRDPSIVGQMESGLRDEFHEVRTKRVQESVHGQTHTWKFDSSLLVAAREPSKYQSHLPHSGSTAVRRQQSTSMASALPDIPPPMER